MNRLIELLPHFLGLGVLLVLSGFFSGSETAIFSLGRARVRRMDDGSFGERAVSCLLREPQRLLSTILIGNMLVNVMLTSIIASLFSRLFVRWSIPVAASVSTVLLLVFGEVTPKTLAVHCNQAFARFTAVPLLWFRTVLFPVHTVLRVITNALLTVLGQRNVRSWGLLTQREIAAMLVAGEAAGVNTGRERELVENILELNDIDARDIMVPRTEVMAVGDGLTVAEAYEQACRFRHSRIPVYQDGVDDIWAILCVVDLSRWRGTEVMHRKLAEFRPRNGEPFPEGTPLYPAHVVPETAKVEALLGMMQELRSQFVVIVDEYGGTAGILTLDDILEEVVGQISPVKESDRQAFVVENGVILADGATHLRDLNRDLKLALPQNGADTVGGYVMELLGRLPRAGDVGSDEHHRFHVIKMVGRRIASIRIEKLVPPNGEDDH